MTFPTQIKNILPKNVFWLIFFAFALTIISQNETDAQGKSNESKAKNKFSLFPDEYSELDDLPLPSLTSDEIVMATIETTRQKYEQALDAVEKKDNLLAAKLFEEAVNELNTLVSYPGIEKNFDFIELSQSLIEDYELFANNNDDLDFSTPYFIIKDKIYDDLERIPQTGAKADSKSIVKVDISKEAQKQDYAKIKGFLLPPDSLQIPMEINDEVQNNINFYLKTPRHKKYVIKMLERSTKWNPMMSRIAKEEGLPQEIVYLAMRESLLDPNAVSKASAVGLWQFMRPTGIDYGLNTKESFWIDERRDPEKSTRSAMRYLRDLYNQFGDWHLALAAYNCGQGRVQRTIRDSKMDNPNYWDIQPLLPRETRHYVGLYIATSLISMYPEEYGFHLDSINFQDEYTYDIYPTNEPVVFEAVAACANTSVQAIKDLNPELIKNSTPPNVKNYQLKIPKGSYHTFASKFSTLSDSEKQPFVTHIVRKGENLSIIASKYGISKDELADVNDLNNSRTKLRAGLQLKLPISQSKYEEINSSKVESIANSSSPSRRDVTHTIRRGETLNSIARRYGMSLNELSELNNLGNANNIKVGQKLIIAKKTNGREINTDVAANDKVEKNKNTITQKQNEKPQIIRHKVKKGESIGRIADEYAVSVESILKLNNIKKNKIQAGQVLKIQTNADYTPDEESDVAERRQAKNSKIGIHSVKKGETLSIIAAKYGLTEDELKELNGKTIKGNTVFAGTNLKVKDNGTLQKGSAEPSKSNVKSAPKTYNIQQGETLSQVARKFGVSIASLKKINRNLDENKLQIGQKIRIQ